MQTKKMATKNVQMYQKLWKAVSGRN